jgi:hypothetical protein
MDAAFLPTEVTIKHIVSHKFIFEISPSVISLGKGVRNLIIGVLLVHLTGQVLRDIIALRPVHQKDNRPGSKE